MIYFYKIYVLNIPLSTLATKILDCCTHPRVFIRYKTIREVKANKRKGESKNGGHIYAVHLQKS